MDGAVWLPDASFLSLGPSSDAERRPNKHPTLPSLSRPGNLPRELKTNTPSFSNLHYCRQAWPAARQLSGSAGIECRARWTTGRHNHRVGAESYRAVPEPNRAARPHRQILSSPPILTHRVFYSVRYDSIPFVFSPEMDGPSACFASKNHSSARHKRMQRVVCGCMLVHSLALLCSVW